MSPGFQMIRRGMDLRSLPADLQVIEGRDLGDDEVLALLGFAGLRRVDLAGCEELTDRSVSRLSSLPCLEALDVSLCNQITDASIVAIARRGRLRELDLSGCYAITDESLRTLSICRMLERLNLAHCEGVSDIGLKALAELACLKAVVLPESASITDQGLRALGRSPNRFQELSLTFLDQITSRGLDELSHMSSLKRLTIKGCDLIRANDVDRFRRKVPLCEILYSEIV